MSDLLSSRAAQWPCTSCAASAAAATGRVVPAGTEMHTGAFVALRDAILAEHTRRTGEYQLAA